MSKLTTAEILTKLASPTSRQELLNSWPLHRCSLCTSRAATGIWFCRFERNCFGNIVEFSELKLLCPACGFADGYLRWNGFMTPKLTRVDLLLTLSAPDGDKRTLADKLLEEISTHDAGEQWINAWKLMFKPANIHYPIAPAIDTLREIHRRLFPPQQGPMPRIF